MPYTIQLYTLDELKKKFPDGYAEAYKKWQDVTNDWCTPWANEIYKSYEALAQAFGYTIVWDDSPYDRYPELKTSLATQPDQNEVFKIIKNLGYELDGNGNFQFTGLCKLTGYCADEDLLEYFWGQIKKGYSCSTAIMMTKDKVDKLLSDETEYQQSEECMCDTWANKLFTAKGQKINL